MLAVALFGTVSGLEVRTFGKVPLLVQEAWIEWPIAEVALSDEPTLYVTRQATPSGMVTWIGLYKCAREIGGERRGGYLGAGVWLLGKAVGSAVLLEYLRNLVVQVEALATAGGQFVRRLSDIEGEVDWQEEMGRAVSTSLRDVQPGGGLRAADLPRVLVDSAGSDLAAHFLDLVQEGPGFFEYRGAVISTLTETTMSARRLGRMRVVEFSEWAGSVVSQLLEQNRKLDAAKGAAVRADEAIKSLNSQLAESRRETQDWQRSTEQAQLELAKSRTVTGALQTSANNLSRQVADLQETLASVRTARDGLQTKSDELAREVGRLKNQPNNMANEVAQLRRQLKDAESGRDAWRLQAQLLSREDSAWLDPRQEQPDARIGRYTETAAMGTMSSFDAENMRINDAAPRRQATLPTEGRVSTAKRTGQLDPLSSKVLYATVGVLTIAVGVLGVMVIQPFVTTQNQKQDDAKRRALPIHSQVNTASAPQGAASTTQVFPMPAVVPGPSTASAAATTPAITTTTMTPSTSTTAASAALAKAASESKNIKATPARTTKAAKPVPPKAPASATGEQPSERAPAAAPKQDPASAPAGPKTDGP